MKYPEGNRLSFRSACLAACILLHGTALVLAQGQPVAQPRSTPANFLATRDIPWSLAIAIVTGVAAVLAILDVGYKVGKRFGNQVPGISSHLLPALLQRRRLTPDEKTASTRRASIDALRELLESTRKRLAAEPFPGVKKVGDQLWRIHMELERLEWWLDLYAARDIEHSALLEKIEKSTPMEIDLVFLRYVSVADAIFSEEIRGRCERLLLTRAGNPRADQK